MPLFIILFSSMNAGKASITYELDDVCLASKQVFENLYIDIRN
jgi:hypothetical protein